MSGGEVLGRTRSPRSAAPAGGGGEPVADDERGRRNPYVGLVPYTEADAAWFFGRDREVRLIIANLRAARLTLLYGASGAGKSSILLAGVLPHLHSLIAEHRPAAGAEATAERPPLAITVFRDWRDPPLEPLAAALHAAVVEAAGDDAVEPWDGEQRFTDWLHGLTRHARTLLVVLDQFEEYFQYHPDEYGPGTFAAELPAIVNDAGLRVHFMLSLREDAWARLDRFKGDIPELFGNYLRVDYLDREAAQEAIVRPVERFNALLEPGEEPVRLEPELVDAILRDVRTGRLALAESRVAGPGTAPARGDERVETPYLQLVMERLWAAATGDGGHALTRETLEDLGGAASIVSSHLKDAMAALSPDDQAIAADVFGFLVTPSKTKVAHRASDLAYWAQRPDEEVRRVLDDLTSSERRILRRVPPPGDEDVDRYEIFHDVLAEAILEWSADNRQKRERAAARRARVRARRRLALRVLGALVVVAAVATTVIALLDDPGRSAEEVRRDRAASSIGIAAGAEAWLASDPERSLILARRAYEVSPTAEAARALGRAYASSRIRGGFAEQSSAPCERAECRPRAVRRERPEPVALALPVDGDQPQSGAVASLSRDGQTLALIRDGEVHLWPTAGGRVETLPRIRNATQVAFLPGGRRLLVLTERGRLLLADGAGAVRRVAEGVSLAAASADGRYFATLDLTRRVRVARIDRPGRTLDERRPRFGASPFGPTVAAGLLFSPTDAGVVAAWGPGGRPVLWDWREPAAARRPAGARPLGAGVPAFAVPAPPAAAAAPVAPAASPCLAAPGAFRADGELLLTAAPGGRVTGWSTADPERRLRLPGAAGCTSAVRVDPRGHLVLVASGNVATIFAMRGGQAVATLGGHSEAITDAAFSPSGTRVATASADGSARVWDVRTGVELMALRKRGLGDRVTRLAKVAFTPDGRFVVTVDEEGVAGLWDVTTRQRLRNPRRAAVSATFADDGRIVVTLRNGRIVSVPRDGGRPEELGDFRGHVMYGQMAAGAPGAVAVVAFRRSGPGAWLLQPGRERPRLLARGFPDVSISDDGREVAVRTPRRLRIWQSGETGGSWKAIALNRTERRTYGGGAELSEDGQRVLVASFDRGGRIVDIDGGDSVRLLDESEPAIATGDFSPDGRQLVTVGGGEALVWDTATGREPAPLAGQAGAILRARFSWPDGRHIATVDSRGVVRLFDAKTHAEVSALPGGGPLRSALAFDSQSNAAVLIGAPGLELRRCEACQPAEWLMRNARLRVTRSPAEIERIERSPAVP